jgi:gamma-glutamyltranspeptidase/glutathione hydrolase/leukotriene-C4 hydrolase
MVIRAPPRSASFASPSSDISELWSNTSTYLSPEGSPFLVNITRSKAVDNGNETSTLIAIDFRETAPHASNPQMYLRAPLGSSQVGGLSVGVPGELRGLYTAYEMYGSGRLGWDELVMPVVELAKGWRVSRELARRFRIYGSEHERMRSSGMTMRLTNVYSAGFMEGRPEWEDVFRPYQQMLVEGDYMSRLNYSRSLASIAKYGPSVFYGKQQGDGKDDESNGHAWIAKEMIETIRREGGILTRDDLRGYKVRVYEPMRTTYHGKTVWTTDAPSCGEFESWSG